jgi:hypothetical protein
MRLIGYLRQKLMDVAALGAVLLLVAGAGYDIKRTPPVYVDSATVLFSAPESDTSPTAYETFMIPLITTGEIVSQIVMSPQGQHQIQEAGGTASVNMTLANLYDEEYPNYGVPMATLTSTSKNAAASQHTFTVAVQQLDEILAARQARMGIKPDARISAQIIAATGPVAQSGSGKRVYGGLAILAMVAVSALWGMINRRRQALPVPPTATRAFTDTGARI